MNQPKKMAKLHLLILAIALSFNLFHQITAAATVASPSSNFITENCETTSFPDICVRYLSAFAAEIQQSPRQLAQTALTLSLSRSRTTKINITKLGKSKGLKPREIGASKDCIEEMGDMADRLGKSTRELRNAGRANYEERRWRLSNVETWVSAGLTDQSTCLEGFEGEGLSGKIKDAVRAQVLDTMHCTSIALALITQYANKS